MSHPNPSVALASVVVDELVRAGVGLAVICPGSRSTAVAMAFVSRGDIEDVVVIDERSAGFWATGWAKATSRPAAVVTTSGTAVANLLPAVVEADSAGVPLVLLTCDRPPEARRTGANQVIRQAGIFGDLVRWSVDLGPAERHISAPSWWRSIVSQSVAAAEGSAGRPGPVQVNLAFREPTVSVSDDGRSREEPFAFDTSGREGGGPWTVSVPPGAPDDLSGIVRMMARSRRGVIVAGGGCRGAPSVVALGRHLGWPVLATAESGLRGDEDSIAAGHHILGSEAARPDLVLRFGTPGPSARVADVLAADVPQVVVADSWSDPGRRASMLVGANIGSTAERLRQEVDPQPAGGWVDWWRNAEAAVRKLITRALGDAVTEPSVAAALGTWGADRAAVASSMPIRDVEVFAFECPPIVANRGASGVDGFVSTALGMAKTAATPVALTGDISLLHDGNGFMCDPRPDCVFVVIDNGGGGIFSFLPPARFTGAQFDRVFATPPGLDLTRFAGLHGLGFRKVDGIAELREAVDEQRRQPGCGLVVAETDRSENVHVHRALDVIAEEALASLPAP